MDNFEENMENIKNIVKELEEGKLNLDQYVKKFEEGINISKKCNEILENAEKKVTILLQDQDNNEEIEEIDFEE